MEQYTEQDRRRYDHQGAVQRFRSRGDFQNLEMLSDCQTESSREACCPMCGSRVSQTVNSVCTWTGTPHPPACEIPAFQMRYLRLKEPEGLTQHHTASPVLVRHRTPFPVLSSSGECHEQSRSPVGADLSKGFTLSRIYNSQLVKE